MHKKNIMFIIAGIFVILAGTIYIFNQHSKSTNSGNAGRIFIQKTQWTGSVTGSSNSTTTSENVEKGKQIILNQLTDSMPYTLTIENVDDSKVYLSTKGLFVHHSNPNINLNECMNTSVDKKQEFSLQKGQSMKISTCTMDAGISWIISYGN